MGCAQDQGDPRDIHGVNPVFVSYVQEFEVQYGRSIGDIPIQFAALGGSLVGLCTVWSPQYKEIKIDPGYWNFGAIDDDAREALIAHELGHCVLGRAHLSTSWNDPSDGLMPTSLMNATVFFNDGYPDWQYLKTYYYNELFHPSPGVPMMSLYKEMLDRTDFELVNPNINKQREVMK